MTGQPAICTRFWDLDVWMGEPPSRVGGVGLRPSVYHPSAPWAEHDEEAHTGFEPVPPP
ncbi:MAG: hypothetical protein QOK32_1007 [Gaiellaceae bacterium]|nr:hypothetical protein [Gaiellaceae bacterium]